MYFGSLYGCIIIFLFFFKQKTAYEMRISDWSSDVCSSDLPALSLEDLYAKPAHLIRRAHQISWAIFLDECADFNLTPVQYAALAAIEAKEPTDATRLSALIAFDRATIGNVQIGRASCRESVCQYV